MRKLMGFSLISFVLLSAVIANAAPFVGSLTFEGLTNGEAVGDFYQALGITFTGFNAVSGDYYTCLNTLVTCSATVGYGAIMNVEPGFEKGLSFYFKSGGFGEIFLYDGVNGQGTLLADVILPPATYDWEPFGFGFNGLAKSALFNGGMEVAVLTMGGGMVLPEPSTVLLFLSGLGTLAGAMRRR